MVKRTKNEIIIEVPYAGLTRDDIDIEYQNGWLRIQKKDKEEDKRHYFLDIFESFNFFGSTNYGYISESTLKIDPAIYDVEKITASMHHGMLRVKVPYKNIPDAKKIKID